MGQADLLLGGHFAGKAMEDAVTSGHIVYFVFETIFQTAKAFIDDTKSCGVFQGIIFVAFVAIFRKV
jgi:hypothetical protein